MSLTLDRPVDGEELALRADGHREQWSAGRMLAIAAAASLAAGAMHVAAIAAHAEHKPAVWAFLGLALTQLTWGAVALSRPRRWLGVVGVAIGCAALVGWIIARTWGLSFVDGLDKVQPVRFADGLAAGLAALTIVGSAVAVLARTVKPPKLLAALVVGSISIIGVPGTVSAVNHQHPTTAVAAEPASAVPPRPFDPARPIDLSGVEGVSAAQQARAENLLAATVMILPMWNDPAFAESRGFRSINDGGTGVEHYVNQAFMNNDTILNPNEPESLVYDTTVSPKKLVAAMYMMPSGSTLADVPDVGGALTQWHIHNNLCFNAQAHVAGLTQGDGSCAPPLVKGPETPMIHVWITPHRCGPFSALEGIGGGQVAEGETVACDHLHGS